MSENEPFLARWTRLKHATAKRPAGTEAKPAAPGEAAPVRGAPHAPAAPAAPAAPEQGEGGTEAFDPASLPAVESIDATTDITAFFARNVPADLTRAALRRVWAADPSIRGFIGLSENAWDFNAPGGVPGFGPLGPADDAAQLLARMGQLEPVEDVPEIVGSGGRPHGNPPLPENEAAETAPDRIPSGSGNAPRAPSHDVVKAADDPVATPPVSDAMQRDNKQNKNEDVATQHSNNSDELLATTRPRAHGGALPK